MKNIRIIVGSKNPVKVLSVFAALIIVTLPTIDSAQAIPAFARKYEAKCSSCHNGWPALNAAGRQFKENGYRKSRKEQPGFMSWDQQIPLTAMIKSRPFEKKDSGGKKIRALHEVELMAAGVMAQGFSGWFELEAEDDANSFDAAIKSSAVSYHLNDTFNAQASWGTITWSDPYDTFSDARKLTRNRSSLINQSFGGADNNGRLRDSRQNLTLYGRPLENLFYSVGLSGVASDSEGESSEAFNARLAFDVTYNTMIGAMAIKGQCKSAAANCSSVRDFRRTGIDAQTDIGNIRLMGAFLVTKDDNVNATDSVSNNAMYIEGRYTITKNGRPLLVPLVRLDRYEKKDGADTFDEVTLQLGYYFTENARGFIEYWNINGPDASSDDNMLTLQGEVAF